MAALGLGETVKKTITVMNYSKAAVTATFDLVHSKELSDMEHEFLSLNCTCAAEGNILAPFSGKCFIHLTFAPRKRVSGFSSQVVLITSGMSIPIFMVQGSCKAQEVSLADPSVNFGSIREQCIGERKVIMQNSGDFGTRFLWEDRFLPEFSISPVEGYIPSGTTCIFLVKFHPTKIEKDVPIYRENLQCKLENGQQLLLTLHGTCVSDDNPISTITFKTPVHSIDVQSISLQNRTNQAWEIRPLIVGDMWTSSGLFHVAPQSTVQCAVTYKPVTASGDVSHQGSIYFPLPGGTCLHYILEGTTSAPKPARKIERNIQCRTEYVELLTVINRFPTAQRFKVNIEVVSPSHLEPGTVLKGAEYIDVKRGSQKDYKVYFFAFKEMTIEFRVIIKTEQLLEVDVQELLFKTYKSGPVDVIKLTNCHIRQTTIYDLVVRNPTDYTATFSVMTNVPELTFSTPKTLIANSESILQLQYNPINIDLSGSNGFLELNSAELGNYRYNVLTRVFASGPERTITMTAIIGGTPQLKTVRICNPLQKTKLELSAKVDNSDFQVDRYITVSIGTSEITFDISFDPSSLKEIHGTLILSHSSLDDIVFPLVGTGLPPKVQGPITIKAGSTANALFRNPFDATHNFVFTVDNPVFLLTRLSDVVRPRKDCKIPVTFDSLSSSLSTSLPNTCKLTATPSPAVEGIQWQFYLKGILP